MGEQRLSSTGFTGENVQPRSQPQLGPLHQQQVLDAKLIQHGSSSTCSTGRNGTNRRSWAKSCAERSAQRRQAPELLMQAPVEADARELRQ